MRRLKQQDGQGTVEFSLVFPIVSALCFGLISASFIFFQASALTNGARNGARLGSIELASFNTDNSSFLAANEPSGGVCNTAGPTAHYGETGQPGFVYSAAQAAMPGVNVNTAPLCDFSGAAPGALCSTNTGQSTGGGNTITLTQASPPTSPAQASISVKLICGLPPGQSAGNDAGGVVSVSVTVSRSIKGLAPPTDKVYTYTATSVQKTLTGF